MARKLAKEEGLFVGISSGATATAALRVSPPSLPFFPACRQLLVHCVARCRRPWRSWGRGRRLAAAWRCRGRVPAQHTAPARLPQVAARPENKGKLIVVMFSSFGEVRLGVAARLVIRPSPAPPTRPAMHIQIHVCVCVCTRWLTLTLFPFPHPPAALPLLQAL